MQFVLTLVGLVLGGMLAEWAGALAGAALGYAIGMHLSIRARLDAQDEVLARLERHERERAFQDRKSAPAPEPRVAPVYEKETPASRAPRPLPEPTRALSPSTVSGPVADSKWQPTNAATGFADAPADATRTEPPPLAREPLRAPRRIADEHEFPSIVGAIRDWFLGGNLVVRVGIVVLFIGVGFLLKFAVDRNMLPIEFRLAGAALGGAALLVLGWRMRDRMRSYALALQGGGVGLLYLTAFAALKFYDLLPAGATFAMLVAVAALAAFLAVGQNALVLAVLGALGGFMAPILTSTGEGNHVVLFSYYALLNAGIVAIAWFKAWRPLNLLAFVFTYGIGTAWGVLRYAPENFATTEPFVVLFFFMFVAVALLFALRTAPRLTDYVDGTLVFGTPVVTMLLQSALVRGRPYALAFSALALSAVYLFLASYIWRRRREQLRLLAESFLALGVAFATLAVPLALDGHWTAGTWALEGAAIFWIGLRQDRGLAIASGLLLQLGAAFAFAVGHDVVPAHVPLANSEFVGALLIAVGGLATARVAHRYGGQLPRNFHWLTAVPFYWALCWWSFAGLNEMVEFVAERHWLAATVGFATSTALGCVALSRWDDWQVARTPPVLLLPVMLILAVAGLIDDDHLLVGAGVYAWPAALVAWIWLLRWRDRHVQSATEPVLHLVTLWFVVAVSTLELAWQIENLKLGDAAWHRIVSGLVPTLALAAILMPAMRARWPVSTHERTYTGVGVAALALYLWVWVMALNFDDAGARPLPYLPIANPVEIVQTLALAGIASWLLHLRRTAANRWQQPDTRRVLLGGFASGVFALLNAMLLRFIHHASGIAYELDVLMASTLVQASLSIFWGVLALGSMVFGTQRLQRMVWFAGAGLLAVVLAKMFLVDLSRTGTVARIVSFIGVGVLMLIIGRFSPMPPAAVAAEAVR